MNEEAEAPRFDAYFAHCQGLPVITMQRSHWDMIVKEPGKLVNVNVSETPMSDVAACVTACVAQEFLKSDPNSGDGFVNVYRRDPADGSTPINTDKYEVWMGSTLRQREDFLEAVAACVTTADSNLTQHLNETVYLVKREADKNHHLEELPSHVKVVYNAG